MSQSKTSGKKSVAGMGSIRKKEKIVNGKAYTYYEARYTVGIDLGTGKQIQKSISGKTQREVAKRLKEITTSIDTGTYLPSCKLTVGEWLNTWISEYTADWKPLTVSNYSKQIKKHLIPRLGAAKLEDLDAHTIKGEMKKFRRCDSRTFLLKIAKNKRKYQITITIISYSLYDPNTMDQLSN